MRTIKVSILVWVFLFPFAVQLGHGLKQHEHVKICSAKKEAPHLHKESKLDCTICDFHFMPFTYDVTNYSVYSKAEIPTKIQSLNVRLPHTSDKTNVQLRAPPSQVV